MYSIKDITLFIQVVNLGNFSNTAKYLNVSATTIGRQIKNLESSLGYDLIKRDPKVFELTKFGKELYETFQNDLKHFDELTASIQDRIDDFLNISKEPNGKLRVLLPPLIAYDIISEHLPRFIRQYPKINLSVIYDQKINLIEDGIDYALVTSFPTQDSYRVKHIFSFDYKLYCTYEYAEKYGVPTTIPELANHLVVGFYNIHNPNSTKLTNSKNTPIFNENTNAEDVFHIPEQLRITHPLQNNKIVLSNEVICPLIDKPYFQNNVHNKLIKVLPEYSFGKTKLYSVS